MNKKKANKNKKRGLYFLIYVEACDRAIYIDKQW